MTKRTKLLVFHLQFGSLLFAWHTVCRAHYRYPLSANIMCERYEISYSRMRNKWKSINSRRKYLSYYTRCHSMNRICHQDNGWIEIEMKLSAESNAFQTAGYWVKWIGMIVNKRGTHKDYVLIILESIIITRNKQQQVRINCFAMLC